MLDILPRIFHIQYEDSIGDFSEELGIGILQIATVSVVQEVGHIAKDVGGQSAKNRHCNKL